MKTKRYHIIAARNKTIAKNLDLRRVRQLKDGFWYGIIKNVIGNKYLDAAQNA